MVQGPLRSAPTPPDLRSVRDRGSPSRRGRTPSSGTTFQIVHIDELPVLRFAPYESPLRHEAARGIKRQRSPVGPAYDNDVTRSTDRSTDVSDKQEVCVVREAQTCPERCSRDGKVQRWAVSVLALADRIDPIRAGRIPANTSKAGPGILLGTRGGAALKSLAASLYKAAPFLCGKKYRQS